LIKLDFAQSSYILLLEPDHTVPDSYKITKLIFNQWQLDSLTGKLHCSITS
jgi:hypothetical protein